MSGVLFVSDGRRVDVCLTCEEGSDDLPVPGPHSGHERCQAARLRGIRVGPCGQQLLDHWDTGVLARPSQRRDTVVVGGVHVGARAQQEINRFEIIPVGCVQERRHPVGTGDVHVDTFVQ